MTVITDQIKIYLDKQDADAIHVYYLKNILLRFEDEAIAHCIKTRNTIMLSYLLSLGLQVNETQTERMYMAAYQQHYDILYFLLSARKWPTVVLGGVILNAGPNLFQQDKSLLQLIYGDDI